MLSLGLQATLGGLEQLFLLRPSSAGFRHSHFRLEASRWRYDQYQQTGPYCRPFENAARLRYRRTSGCAERSFAKIYKRVFLSHLFYCLNIRYWAAPRKSLCGLLKFRNVSFGARTYLYTTLRTFLLNCGESNSKM